MISWQPASLDKRPNIEVILISGFMNSEIRITSNNICRIDSYF